MTNTPTPLMTPPDVEKYTGIPLKTLYRWRAYGYGPPAIKIGKHLRYRLADVDAWLDERKQESARWRPLDERKQESAR